jgi:ribulose-phosphate 3-epimerase
MSRKIRTVPAILTDDPQALQKMVALTETFTDYAQLDIMDGRFVPSRSISCDAIAALTIKLTWEAHLMVLHPEDCLEDFRKAGAQKIVFHFEATPVPEEIIEKIRGLDLKAGLAVNPETPLDAFTSLVDKLDSVLFLSVNPGFYGAKFIPEVLDKITDLRRDFPDLEIGIDGGVKDNNIAAIARTGVDVICIGSAVFNQPDPAASYRRLTALAEAAVKIT